MCKTILVILCFALLLSLAAAGLAAPITAVASGGKSTLVLRSDGTV